MDRKQARLLSSLRDLKLDNNKSLIIEEGKRHQRRVQPIKLAAEGKIEENFTVIARNKNEVDKSIILKSLSSHFTFSTLIKDKHLRDVLIQQFALCKVEKGHYLMKQNDDASSFFLLHEGSMAVEIDGDAKRKIVPGEGFGELALLYSAPRSASIKALEDSLLWFIDRATFKNVVSSIIDKKYKDNREFIENNGFFRYLTSAQKDRIASIAISQKFQKNAKICKEGDLASAMFIVKYGKLKRVVDGHQVGELGKGDSFEEYATLKKGSIRRETVTVVEEAEVIALGVQDIETTLGRSFPLIILRNTAREVLKVNQHFRNFSELDLERLLDCFTLRTVKEKEMIISQTTKFKGSLIFFVVEGSFDLPYKNETVLYGTQQLDAKKHKDVYCFDMVAKEESKIACTTLEQIEKLFESSFDKIKRKSAAIKKMDGERQSVKVSKESILSIQLTNMEIIDKLGEGQFGNVFLVRDKKQYGKHYALKCIPKQMTIKYKLEKHLMNEKKVLEEIDSPFLVNYFRSFKDDYYVYLLMEFVNGIQLFDAIRVIGLLTASQTRFFAANLLVAIETLHTNGILYRDLKPENVMVCENGYLKVVDMGTSKKMAGKSIVQKTFTIIGTPNYMAPEIISGKGYGYMVDLWSVGIMMYEFLVGYVPFGDESEDPYEIYQEIMEKDLEFPAFMLNKHANSLITQLLSKNPCARLGSSFASLKNHSFFKDFEWHKLASQTMKSVFTVPKQRIRSQKNLDEMEAQSFDQMLKFYGKKVPTRKDLMANWDDFFIF